MEEYQVSDDAMMNTSDENRKKKTIIVASIAGAVVLIAAIWGIISIINSINSKKTTVAETNTEETTKVEEVDTNAHGTISPSDEFTASTEEEVVTDSPVVSDTQETVAPVKETPATGPADMVATAVLAGIAVALVARNIQISKR